MPILLGQLLHSPADIFRYLLIQAGYGILPVVGSLTDWPVTADTELDQPDNIIAVTNTQGETYGRIHVTGEQPEHFGIQIKVRSSLSTTGWTKANAIAVGMDQLLSFNSVTIGSNEYHVKQVTRKGSVLSLGREIPSSRRFLFTLNSVVVIHQIS